MHEWVMVNGRRDLLNSASYSYSVSFLPVIFSLLSAVMDCLPLHSRGPNACVYELEWLSDE